MVNHKRTKRRNSVGRKGSKTNSSRRSPGGRKGRSKTNSTRRRSFRKRMTRRRSQRGGNPDKKISPECYKNINLSPNDKLIIVNKGLNDKFTAEIVDTRKAAEVNAATLVQAAYRRKQAQKQSVAPLEGDAARDAARSSDSVDTAQPAPKEKQE